jgi:PAS domain S-box-containing protein
VKDELRAEASLRELDEEAPIAFLTADLIGRITGANRRACQLLGRADLAGTALFDHAADGPAGRERLRRAHDEFHRGGEPAGLEVEMKRPDGRPLWIAAWFQPMRDSDGQVAGSRCTWLDVTDRVLAQQEKARLLLHSHYLQDEIKAQHNFEEIVGRSPALLAVLDAGHRVAGTDSTVLITGETGTGKELIARAIHGSSRRRDRPFIKVNCAEVPAGLVESDLFGHEKGCPAAASRRMGRFELAHGSILFLDEIGELPADAQARLLDVLQKREIERPGGGPALRVDVQVLAASNRDLPACVRAGRFREDLYYRLSVFTIRLPPLRERKEDIPLLVHFLIGKFVARIGKHVETVSPETMCRLGAYDWPGNVRELANVLERAVLLAGTPVLEIGPDVLPLRAAPAHGHCAATLEATERQHILGVLGQTKWVIDGPKGAARILGLHPNTLRSRLKKLGIHRPGHTVKDGG